MFSLLSGVHLGMELLGHKAALCLILRRTARLFAEAEAPFSFPSSCARGLLFLCILTHTCCFPFFLIVASLESVKRYLITNLITISLMANAAEHFSYIYWPLVPLLWRNIYLIFVFLAIPRGMQDLRSPTRN